MENGEEAVKFFVKSDKTTYPTTHVDNAIPNINPRTMTMADLLIINKKLRTRYDDCTSGSENSAEKQVTACGTDAEN